MIDHLIDLEALLDRFQVERLLYWAGHSRNLMELALKLPERVSGLILIATAARPLSSHPPNWQDNLYTGVASILNRLQPSWQWNIDTRIYRYLIQQHTPTAYRYLAFEAMSAYLQTSAAAQRAGYRPQSWVQPTRRLTADSMP